MEVSHSARFRIVVRGEIDNRMAVAFERMSLRCGHGTTTLEGDVPDQAALQGLIDRVADFGLELISVNRVDAADGAS